MGVRNRDHEVIERPSIPKLSMPASSQKSSTGSTAPPLVSKAILGIVKEVYFPFISPESGEPAPGKITLIAVATDEPAGKAIADCKKQTVCLTLHRGNVNHSFFSITAVQPRLATAQILTFASRLSVKAPSSLPRTLPIASFS